MKVLVLLFALLLSPPLGPDDPDDPEKEDEDTEISAEQVDLEAAEAVRYTPEYQTLYRSQANGKLHTSFGYGTVSGYFDGDGDYQDLLGNVGGGDINALAWNIAGSYDAVVIRDMKIRLGAGLSMYTRERSGPQVTTDDTGFGLQNASFFGEILKPNYSFRTGFFYDFARGQNPEDQVERSDGVHAINFRVTGQYPTQQFRVFGGAEYLLTLRGRTFDELGGPNATSGRTLEYAPGDQAHLHGGGGLRFGQTIEAGVTLHLRIQREGQYDSVRGPDLGNQVQQINGQQVPVYEPTQSILAGGPNEFDAGYLLSASPYVNYAPVEMPFQFYFKGAFQHEYQDYGFALFGENTIAPRLGGTLGLIYEL